MIYSIDKSDYPSEYEQLNSYKDLNDFEWRIAVADDGLYVTYHGDKYFLESYFTCYLKNDESIMVNNTGCLFFKNKSFDLFYEIRDNILNNYTDVIQDYFTCFFQERFDFVIDLLDSEKIL